MKRLTVLLTGLLIGAPFLAENLMAAEWERGAGVSLGAEFSDNICLSSDNESAQGFATVTPDVSLRGRGARANVSLAGSVQYNTLAEADLNCVGGQGSNLRNRQTWTPNIRYRGDLDLVEDWLTLESDASARTTNIDPFAAGNTNGLDGRNNVNIVYQYGAGARIQRRVSNSADMLLRYNYNEQHNEVTLLGDSSEDLAEFNLGTERANNRLTVGVSGRYSKVTYEERDTNPAFDNTLSSAETRASLRLTRNWQINGLVGEEWNEFTSMQPDIDGTYWDAGVRWSPNDRIEVNLGTGERYFGSTPRMNILYRHKRSELTANYGRSLTFPRNLRAASGGFENPLDTEFDTVGVPGQLPGGPLTIGGEPTFIGNTPIINERLSIRYSYSVTRTTVSVSASNSRQQRLEDLNEATFSNVGLSLSRSLSSALSANLNLVWSEREGRGSNVGIFGNVSQTWGAVLGLNRRLGRNTTVNMSIRHTLRESDTMFNEYTENRVILSARHQF